MDLSTASKPESNSVHQSPPVQGKASTTREAFEKLGTEMYGMTTTVHSPNIPFEEACACIPAIWENLVQERDRLRAALERLVGMDAQLREQKLHIYMTGSPWDKAWTAARNALKGEAA